MCVVQRVHACAKKVLGGVTLGFGVTAQKSFDLFDGDKTPSRVTSAIIDIVCFVSVAVLVEQERRRVCFLL